MALNWGGMAGGLAQGFRQGVDMGNTLAAAKKRHELDDLRKQGVAEATAAREAAMRQAEQGVVDTQEQASRAAQAPQPEARAGQVVPESAAVTTQAVPMPAAGGFGQPQRMGPPADVPVEASPAVAPVDAPAQVSQQPIAAQGIAGKRFQVGGQGFDTREQAVAAAQKKVPSVADFVTNSVVPKMQAWYAEQGDAENAERLGQYMESKRGKEAVKSFGTAMQKLMFGNDINGGVQALGDYYNKYIDDGVDFTKGEVGADGRINITVKDRASGTERVMPMSRDEVVRLGMAHDPAQLFKMGLAQVEANAKTAAELAKEQRQEKAEIRKEGRAAVREVEKESRAEKAKIAADARAADARVEEKTLEARLADERLGETGKKARDLKKLGWSDDEVKKLLQGSNTTTGRAPHPEAIALQVYNKKAEDERTKYDTTGADGKPTKLRFNELSEAERKRVVAQEVRNITGILEQPDAAPAAKPGAAAKPTGPRYVKDPRTGQVGVLENGKFTPLKP